MHRRNQKRKVFRDILTKAAPGNAQLMMTRARTANKLAKMLKGKAREGAYNVKHKALVALTQSFPGQIDMCVDTKSPEFVIVRFASASFALHAPAYHFRLRSEEKWAA